MHHLWTNTNCVPLFKKKKEKKDKWIYIFVDTGLVPQAVITVFDAAYGAKCKDPYVNNSWYKLAEKQCTSSHLRLSARTCDAVFNDLEYNHTTCRYNQRCIYLLFVY